jgi:histidyl-tRNA synthetase
MQVGAELYGHAGIAADREVLRLMLSSLRALGVSRVHLDLGHVGVFRALVDRRGSIASVAPSCSRRCASRTSRRSPRSSRSFPSPRATVFLR